MTNCRYCLSCLIDCPVIPSSTAMFVNQSTLPLIQTLARVCDNTIDKTMIGKVQLDFFLQHGRMAFVKQRNHYILDIFHCRLTAERYLNVLFTPAKGILSVLLADFPAKMWQSLLWLLLHADFQAKILRIILQLTECWIMCSVLILDQELRPRFFQIKC